MEKKDAKSILQKMVLRILPIFLFLPFNSTAHDPSSGKPIPVINRMMVDIPVMGRVVDENNQPYWEFLLL